MRRGGPRAGDEYHSDGQRRSADARTAALHALHAAPCRSSATPSSRRGRVCLGESDEKVYACEVFSRRDGADPASTRALFQLFQGAAAGAALARRVPPRRNRAEYAGMQAMPRSEEHTSELQSLMRISYAVFC